MGNTKNETYTDRVLDLIGKLDAAGIDYRVDVAIVPPSLPNPYPSTPKFLSAKIDFRKIEEDMLASVKIPDTGVVVEKGQTITAAVGEPVEVVDPLDDFFTEDEEAHELVDRIEESEKTEADEDDDILSLAPPAPLEPAETIPPVVDGTENAADDIEDDDDFDAVTVPDPAKPSYLDADEVLKFQPFEFPNAKGDAKITVQMYYTASSDLSAIGYKQRNDPKLVTVYARFKAGNTIYRYNPVPLTTYHELLGLAVDSERGIKEASVGSAFWTLLRTPADEGKIKCQRLRDDNVWEPVAPKAERTKALKLKAPKGE